MIPSYNFNQRLKRFEPIEKKCSYCDDKSENSSVDSAYYVPLFKEQDRTNIVVYRSVKYQKVEIGIPRCEECVKIHGAEKTTARLCAFGIFAVVFALGIILFGLIGGVVGFIVALFAGVLSVDHLEERFVLSKGIFTPRDGAERNSVVQTFVLSGWSFNQPTA